MPYRKVIFEKGKPAHIISRAVVDVFRKSEDCYRFIYQFYASNYGKRGFNVYPKDAVKAGQALLYGEKIPSRFFLKEHPPLVSLIDFSLVINHFHFYLVPNIDNATPIFMQRFKNGFAKYFNSAHNRDNTVFGSPYRGIPIENEFQSYAVCRYVNVINTLDVFQPGWREDGLGDWGEALKFIENYEFSSFPDKVGKRNAQILAPKDILNRYSFSAADRMGQEDFREYIKEFLKQRSYGDYDRNIFLE